MLFWVATAGLGSAALAVYTWNQIAPPPATPAGSSSNPTAQSGVPIDGIKCTNEKLDTHFHAHLALLQDGQPVTLPAGIGISNQAQCLYSLHTHQTDGVIHVESQIPTAFTLGQFFDIWGQPLSLTQSGPLVLPAGQSLHVSIDGATFSGDPRGIQLRPHQVLVIGAGQEVPPPPYEFPTNY